MVDGGAPAQPRRAVRVLLIDPDDRVLLLLAADPARPDEPYWYTPGGGIEDDETLPACGVREVYEETGLRLLPGDLTVPVWHDRVEFSLDGRRYRQRQEYFTARSAGGAVAPTGLTDVEVRSWRGFRWWSAEELAATADRVYPAGLDRLLGSLRAVAGERRGR